LHEALAADAVAVLLSVDVAVVAVVAVVEVVVVVVTAVSTAMTTLATNPAPLITPAAVALAVMSAMTEPLRYAMGILQRPV